MSVTGYRVWHIGWTNYRVQEPSRTVDGSDPSLHLRALSGSVHWPPRQLMRARPCAVCRGRVWSLDEFGLWQDRSPIFGQCTNCHCGLHAYIEAVELRNYAEGVRFGSVIFGGVELGGRVMAHVKGYRAELGRITALYRIRSATKEDAVARLRAAGATEEAIAYAEQYYPTAHDRQLERVAALYDVPLLAIEDEDWGEEWLEPIAATL